MEGQESKGKQSLEAYYKEKQECRGELKEKFLQLSKYFDTLEATGRLGPEKAKTLIETMEIIYHTLF